jgi:hypothetical protein
MFFFFLALKRRLGFLRLWNLGLSKKFAIKFPFLSFQQVYGRKLFFSLKSFFFKSFFFRSLPYYLFRFNFCFNKFFFKDVLAFKNFFNSFLGSLAVIFDFNLILCYLKKISNKFDDTFLISYAFARKFFVSSY